MSRRSPEDGAPLDEAALIALAEAIPPAKLSNEQRASMRARVMERAANIRPSDADQPPDTETIRGNDVAWREAWPKVWVKVLRADVAADVQITLMRFEPGGRIPGHAHRSDEECYVIEGEVLVGSHLVRAGDFHVAHAGGAHPDLFSGGGALVMLRSELHRPQSAR
jgi:quercetin dioxygenase-like cupin family protein